jgi:hypothetical protein
MKAIPLLLAVALLTPLAAQNQNPPRQRIPQQAQPQFQPGRPVVPPQMEDAQLPDSNLTISLEGNTTTGSAVDLQLTGTGPTFSADQMIGDEGGTLTCQYTLSKNDKGYRVSYSIGVRVRIATAVVQGQANMTNYEYRDVSLSGTVQCKPGVPVVIVRNAKVPLKLTVSEVPETAVEPGQAPAVEPPR